MRRFAPALRRVAGELDLPPATRALVLAEIAADLEAVYEHQRGRGATEEAAVRKAEELVVVSPEVVRRLGRLHAKSWQAKWGAIAADLGGGVDLLLLLVGVLPVLILSAYTAAMTLSREAGPVMWALGGLALVLVWVVGEESFRLMRGAPVRRGRLSLLRGFAVVAPVLAFLSLVLGVHAVSVDLSSAAGAAGIDAGAQAAAAGRLAADGSVFLVGLLLGIAGALSWFILLHRGSARVAREVAALLADPEQGDSAVSTGFLSLERGGAG